MSEQMFVLMVERDSLRARIAALEAENARLRDATRLRPMSDAPGEHNIWMLCDFPVMGKRWLHRCLPRRPLGTHPVDAHAIGWYLTPEVQDAQAPDTEHYHE